VKCPVCRIDMIAVEHRKIELDYCVQCSGVWFDSGEFEAALQLKHTTLSKIMTLFKK